MSIVLVTALLIAAAFPGGVAKANGPDAFDQMRVKWFEYLTGVGSSAYTADPDIDFLLQKAEIGQNHWDRMDTSANRTYLWSDLTNASNPAQITVAYQRIKEMALVYRLPSSSAYGDTDLRDDILGALAWMYDNRYNEGKYATVPKDSNWWHWEIGAPIQLNDALVLMYDELTATELDRYLKPVDAFSPDPSRNLFGQLTATGANLVWKCQVVGLRAVLLKNDAKLTMVPVKLKPVFDYVTSNDGFYEDGSFVQHLAFAYTGGYGTELLHELSNLMVWLSGSSYAPQYPEADRLYQWIYDSYEPVIYNGAIMDMTRGRNISRNSQQDHTTGHTTIGAIVRLAQLAEPQDAARLRAMVKYWIAADTEFNFYRSTSLSTAIWAKQIADDPSVVSRGPLVQTKVFAGMDQAVHLRPDFGFGLSMSSHRIGNYESINGENLKGWYTAAGMTYLYNDDLRQYTDYWATVDKYRLPGTTVDTMERPDSDGYAYRSPNTWTGGTTLGDQYAAAGMDYKGYGSSLKAKKSWFMFEDEIVALGSGITSSDDRMIETTIENRMLNKRTSADGIDLASPPATPIGSEPLRHKVYAVSNSSNNGNLPENTYDNNLGSCWCSEGPGQWIQFDLGKVQPIGYVAINFMLQNIRYNLFDLLVSEDGVTWDTVYSGTSNQTPSQVDPSELQVFSFAPTTGRYVKFVGQGNSTGGWNSLTEVQIYAPRTAGPQVIPPSVSPWPIAAVAGDSGGSLTDYRIDTHWQTETIGGSVTVDLGSVRALGYAGIAFGDGRDETYTFELEASGDGTAWTTVYTGTSAPTSEVTAYPLTSSVDARYVRLTMNGNTQDDIGRVAELQLYAPHALGPVLSPLHRSELLLGDEQLTVDGTAMPSELGWDAQLADVSYVHLEGTGGYYFPEATDLHALRSVSTGKWSDVDASGPATELSKNYVTLVQEHGVSPLHDKYAYVLLPGKTAAQTAAYAASPETEILVNNILVQAVEHTRLGLIGANFWQPATFGYVTASQPSSMMLKDDAGELKLSISDPTQLQDELVFEVFKQGVSVLEKDASVEIIQLAPTIQFTVDTTAHNGRPHTLKLAYNPSAQVQLPTPTPEPPAEPEAIGNIVTDPLDDFTYMYKRSANLYFDRNDPAPFEGDTSRLARTNTQPGYVIYEAQPNKDLGYFKATAWTWKGETTADMKFYVSKDDQTYEPYTPTKEALMGRPDYWNRIEYSGILPADTRYLKIEFTHSGPNHWNPALGEVELHAEAPAPPEPLVTELDELNDFSKVFERSPNLSFDIANTGVFDGDASRLMRTQLQEEYIIYKAQPGRELSEFSAVVWAWPNEEVADTAFYVSADNIVYEPFVPDKTMTQASGQWKRYVYSGELPEGMQYLKIQYKHLDTTYGWHPQIGEVELTHRLIDPDEPPPIISVLDPLVDFTYMHARSANLSFDNANAHAFGGDTSRLMRTQLQEEYIIYKAQSGRELSALSAVVWAWPNETATENAFYVSEDGVVYEPFVPNKTMTQASGQWKKFVYSGPLPTGTQYLKIQFKHINTTYGWHPQIGQVQLSHQLIEEPATPQTVTVLDSFDNAASAGTRRSARSS